MRPGDESALTAQCLAERSDSYGDALLDTQRFANSAAVITQHTGSVSFVDEERRVVPLGDFHKILQWSDMAVHAEDAVGEDPRPVVLASFRGEGRQDEINIAVWVNDTIGARKPAAIDQ